MGRQIPFDTNNNHDKVEFDYTRRRSSVAPAQQRKFPNTTWTNLFLVATVVEALANMAIEAYVFYKFYRVLNLDNTTARTIPTYLAIYICAFCFQIILAFLAIAKRNTIQVIGLVIFNFAFLVYSAIQIKEFDNVLFSRDAVNVFDNDSGLRGSSIAAAENRESLWHDIKPFLIAVPCIIGATQIIYLLCVFKLYNVFGWDIYQKLGADRRVKRYFLAYQIFVVLLMYDWFFFGGFTVQLLILYVDHSNWEFWVTVAALPITIIGLLAAVYAVQHESHWLLGFFDLCLVAALTYFCYKFWRIFGSSRADEFRNDRITLGIFAGVSLALLVCTVINSIYCQRYFGKVDLWERHRRVQKEEQDDQPLSTIDLANPRGVVLD
jgi:hypothetical protein